MSRLVTARVKLDSIQRAMYTIQDALTLFGAKPSGGPVLSASPFVAKIEAFLKLADIKYKFVDSLYVSWLRSTPSYSRVRTPPFLNILPADSTLCVGQ